MNAAGTTADAVEQLFYSIGRASDHATLIHLIAIIPAVTQDADEQNELERQCALRLDWMMN